LPRPRSHRHRPRQEKRKGEAKIKEPLTLGLRWPVERTNSWFSNFGQLRRNTDRFSKQRLGQIALAVALILTVKLVKWAKRQMGQTMDRLDPPIPARSK
jgi:transposase